MDAQRLRPLSVPKRLLDDVQSIAESLAALPRLIDELVVLSLRMQRSPEALQTLRQDLGPLPAGITQRLGIAAVIPSAGLSRDQALNLPRTVRCV